MQPKKHKKKNSRPNLPPAKYGPARTRSLEIGLHPNQIYEGARKGLFPNLERWAENSVIFTTRIHRQRLR